MNPLWPSSARTLVRLPDWLGDLVMVEPLLRALHADRERLGAAERLTLAGSPRLLALFDGRLRGTRRVDARELAAWRGHDLALLLTGSFRSAWTAWRARIPRRIGYSRDARGSLLTEGFAAARERGGVPHGLGRAGRFPRYLPRPLIDSSIELASLLGVSVADVRPRLEPATSARVSVAARLVDRGIERFVLANVGARPDSAKGLAPERWALLLAALLAEQSSARLVLVGGPGEEGLVRDVARRLVQCAPLAWLDPVADLQELLALCERAELVVTADSGPRHLALSVDAPTLVLMGPSDPRHTSYALTRQRVLRLQLPCSPCQRERCPLTGADHRACLARIEPAAVAHAARELVRGAAPAAGAT